MQPQPAQMQQVPVQSVQAAPVMTQQPIQLDVNFSQGQVKAKTPFGQLLADVRQSQSQAPQFGQN